MSKADSARPLSAGPKSVRRAPPLNTGEGASVSVAASDDKPSPARCVCCVPTVSEVAKILAEAHRKDDPRTIDVFWAEDPHEVRLVEVTDSVAQMSQQEVMPFRLTARPDQGIPYPVVIILLSQEEWNAVARGELSLPAGWDNLQPVR